MSNDNDPSLQRFVDAQASAYNTALAEIKAGKKKSHWMWFIFPQVQGLGSSEMAKRYAIKNKAEASAYLEHPLLGTRLIEICKALAALGSNNASEIFGYPDDLKLKSCLTLFASTAGADPIFVQLLQKFFNGKKDENTLAIIG